MLSRGRPGKSLARLRECLDAQFTECGEMVEYVNHAVRPMQEIESEVLEVGTVRWEDIHGNVDALFCATRDIPEGIMRITYGR